MKTQCSTTCQIGLPFLIHLSANDMQPIIESNHAYFWLILSHQSHLECDNAISSHVHQMINIYSNVQLYFLIMSSM
jgi:hypothetical protein